MTRTTFSLDDDLAEQARKLNVNISPLPVTVLPQKSVSTTPRSGSITGGGMSRWHPVSRRCSRVIGHIEPTG